MAEGTQGEPRPFTGVLQETRKGALHTELSEALAEVVAAVDQNRKAGEVALKITVKPGDGDGVVYFVDTVTKKVPAPAKPATLFFTDEHGRVTRRPPNQIEMPLRDAAAGEETA